MTTTHRPTATALRVPFRRLATGAALAIALLGAAAGPAAPAHALNIGSQSAGSGAGRVTFNAFSITRAAATENPSMAVQGAPDPDNLGRVCPPSAPNCSPE